MSTPPLWRSLAGWIALAVAAVVALAITVPMLMTDDGDEPAQSTGDGATTTTQKLGPIDSFSPEVGQKAPDFVLLDARDGKTERKLSDFAGQAVVLNWFASWCGPCRSEMPTLEAAYQALGAGEGEVVFVGINLMQSRDTTLQMLDETNVSYPALLDADGTVADRYRVTGMPTTYFIDKDGIVRSFGRGEINDETLRGELAKLGYSY